MHRNADKCIDFWRQWFGRILHKNILADRWIVSWMVWLLPKKDIEILVDGAIPGMVRLFLGGDQGEYIPFRILFSTNFRLIPAHWEWNWFTRSIVQDAQNAWQIWTKKEAEFWVGLDGYSDFRKKRKVKKINCFWSQMTSSKDPKLAELACKQNPNCGNAHSLAISGTEIRLRAEQQKVG